MRERAELARRLGMLGRGLEPADRLGAVRLAVVDAAGAELDRGLHGVSCRTRLGVFEPREPALARLQRFGVATDELVQRALLAEQARVEERRLVAAQVARRLVRAERALVRTEALAHVAQLLEDARDLGVGELRHVLGRCDRALVELRGDDVCERRLRSLRGRERVRPRLLVLSRLEEVEREEPGRLLDALARALLECVRDAAVDVATRPKESPS